MNKPKKAPYYLLCLVILIYEILCFISPFSKTERYIVFSIPLISIFMLDTIHIIFAFKKLERRNKNG